MGRIWFLVHGREEEKIIQDKSISLESEKKIVPQEIKLRKWENTFWSTLFNDAVNYWCYTYSVTDRRMKEREAPVQWYWQGKRKYSHIGYNGSSDES
jgi:hypothetical protein